MIKKVTSKDYKYKKVNYIHVLDILYIPCTNFLVYLSL